MISKIKVQGNISVHYYQEKEVFIAYSPMLDLSSCGSTFDEAARNFDEAVQILFSECDEKGTLDEVLLSLGWEAKRRGDGRVFVPPRLIGQKEISIPPMPVAA